MTRTFRNYLEHLGSSAAGVHPRSRPPRATEAADLSWRLLPSSSAPAGSDTQIWKTAKTPHQLGATAQQNGSMKPFHRSRLKWSRFVYLTDWNNIRRLCDRSGRLCLCSLRSALGHKRWCWTVCRPGSWHWEQTGFGREAQGQLLNETSQ